MKDEEFVFRQDVKEKASTARNARYRRTHNGKGGRVKFPSDNLSRKDLQAMNGEVKTYRLNDPMKWDEFKYMPDDIKITYVKLIRKRFNVSDSCIAKMLGISQNGFSNHIKRLGLGLGRGTGNQKSDKEGFLAWCNGAPLPAADPVEETPEAVEQPVDETPEMIIPLNSETAERFMASLEEVCDPVPVQVLPIREEKRKAIPNSGSMTFEGSVESILNTLSVLLGGANVHISITWDVLAEEERKG